MADTSTDRRFETGFQRSFSLLCRKIQQDFRTETRLQEKLKPVINRFNNITKKLPESILNNSQKNLIISLIKKNNNEIKLIINNFNKDNSTPEKLVNQINKLVEENLHLLSPNHQFHTCLKKIRQLPEI